MKTCLYAYTEAGFDPGFVNLSQNEKGELELTVRGHNAGEGKPGYTTMLRLDRATALNLGAELRAAVSRSCNNG